MLIFPLINDSSRKIIHIDMDAFFASVEQRDNPELKGKPVIIGRNPLETGGRGVVSTASYEARKFGVHSAMSSKEAYELCPQAIFISGHYERYREVSLQVREIFSRYTDKIEVASIDEAYLDVTQNKVNSHSAVKIAKLIQYDIYHELNLTCSAGVSYNKFLAKMASDYEKPHGLTIVMPDEAKTFLKDIPVEKFFGVGQATVTKLHDLGIKTGADLQNADPLNLANRFGTYGWFLYLRANGIHDSQVHTSRQRKSVGKERTFGKFLHTEEDIKRELEKLSEGVSKVLKQHDLKGNIVVLKLRYEDFTTLTKRKTTGIYFNDLETLYDAAEDIIDNLELEDKGIRLLGVTVTGFSGQQEELDTPVTDEE